jgi:hypothetical protein
LALAALCAERRRRYISRLTVPKGSRSKSRPREGDESRLEDEEPRPLLGDDARSRRVEDPRLRCGEEWRSLSWDLS